MASRDSAFLWETEVLRSTKRASSDQRTIRSLIGGDDDWLTIREASARTGISATTLKKLARNREIPSHLTKTDDGFLRVVSLEGIRHWEEPVISDTARDASNAEGEVDLTAEEDSGAEPDIPEGTMLVPLDAWNKMLNQLGNLHEAGQQLAEARERAAKAETESRFLKERLAELRTEMERMREPVSLPPETPTPDDASATPSSTKSLARKAYRSWREKRRRS